MKTIRFNGRDWSCIGMKPPEPWREPEIPGAAAWLQFRHSGLNFTPVRWRFICTEGIIAAVPLGYFDERAPERIPVEIRDKTEWREPWLDVQPGEAEREVIEIPPPGEDISKWEMGRQLELPKEVLNKTNLSRLVARKRPLMTRREFVARIKSANLPPAMKIESEYLETYARINRRCPALAEDEIEALMNLIHFEAIYEGDKPAEHFIRVDVLEPLADEAAMIREYNQRTSPRPCVRFMDGFTRVVWPGGDVKFNKTQRSNVIRELFANYHAGNDPKSWRDVASKSEYQASKELNPKTVLVGNRGRGKAAEIKRLIDEIIVSNRAEHDFTIRLNPNYHYESTE